LKAVADHGTTEEYVGKIKQIMLRTHEVNLKENPFWERELKRSYDYGDDPKLIPVIQPLVDQVSSDALRAAARRFAYKKPYVLGVLVPEAASVEAAPAAGGSR